jgi:membrane fusion protein (multidrug efflux system)
VSENEKGSVAAPENHVTSRVATDPAPVPTAKASSVNTGGRRRAFTIFFIVLLLAAVGALLWWLHARNYESTDDAQVDAHLNPVTARIDGTITRVYVDDNQWVKPGDPLVDLDPRDREAALNQVLAQLGQAKSQVTGQLPNVPITSVENATNIETAQAEVANSEAALAAAKRDYQVAEAKLAESEANNGRAQADLARYKTLVAKEEVSQQEYDQIAATAKAQAATVAASRASLQSAAQTVDQRRAQLQQSESKLAQYRRNGPRQIEIRKAMVAANRANAENARAQVESRRLELSYTKISAPVAGIVMKRSAEVGAHISAGQQLMMIVQMADVWVTANYKETQLRLMRPGQPATIHVDALNRDFEGYVENIGGATGSISSVLPPENATGNYVKVVQRIPVRVRFKPNQAGLERLRPGMSVEPNVRIGG